MCWSLFLKEEFCLCVIVWLDNVCLQNVLKSPKFYSSTNSNNKLILIVAAQDFYIFVLKFFSFEAIF